MSPSDAREGRASGPFKGIGRTNRTQLAREQLEGAIRDGTYRAGDRLPSERELVELLGVSRVSVREAMRSLEALGMVEIQHGRGVFVSENYADAYAVPFGRWLSAHHDEVQELLRVRGALDELAAERAAERRDPDGLERVQAACREFRAAAEATDVSLERLAELDERVHVSIGEAASDLLGNLLQELHTVLRESRYVALAPAGRPQKSAEDHDRMLAAILDGRGEDAREAVREHIRSTRELTAKATAADWHEGEA